MYTVDGAGGGDNYGSSRDMGSSQYKQQSFNDFADKYRYGQQTRMEPIDEDQSPLQRWLEEGRYFSGPQNRDGYGGGGGGYGGGYGGGCYCQGDNGSYAIGFGLAAIAAGLVLAAILAAQAAAGRRRRRSTDANDAEDDKAAWVSNLTKSWLKFGGDEAVDDYDKTDKPTY